MANRYAHITTPDGYYSSVEAAEAIGVGYPTFRYFVQRGRISMDRVVTIGGKQFFPIEEVHKLEETVTRPPRVVTPSWVIAEEMAHLTPFLGEDNAVARLATVYGIKKSAVRKALKRVGA